MTADASVTVSTRQPWTVKHFIGFALVRIIVPLWIATGALFKMTEADPRLLPGTIRDLATMAGISAEGLFPLLAVLISLECFAIAVMVFLPKLARAMAIFMLVSFCAILISEMMQGASSCGCLGGYSPAPWQMFAVDAVMLVAVLIFPSRPRRTVHWTGGRWALVGMATVALAVTSFFMVMPGSRTVLPVEPPTPAKGEDKPVAPDPSAAIPSRQARRSPPSRSRPPGCPTSPPGSTSPSPISTSRSGSPDCPKTSVRAASTSSSTAARANTATSSCWINSRDGCRCRP